MAVDRATLSLLGLVVIPPAVASIGAGIAAVTRRSAVAALLTGLLGTWLGTIALGFLGALLSGGVDAGHAHGGVQLSALDWAVVMFFPVGPVPALAVGVVAALVVACRRLGRAGAGRAKDE